MTIKREILRLPQVKATTGLAASTIYLKLSSGDFPKAIKLGPRAVGWFADEIQAWLNDRAQMREGV